MEEIQNDFSWHYDIHTFIFQSFHWSRKNFMKDHCKSYLQLNIKTFWVFGTLDWLQPFKTTPFSLYHIYERASFFYNQAPFAAFE